MNKRKFIVLSGNRMTDLFQRIKALSPLALWPIDETSGTTITDAMGLSNGTATSVTLNNAVFPKYLYPFAKFTTGSRINVYSTALNTAFPKSAGTMLAYVKPTDQAMLTDAAVHYFFNFQTDVAGNFISLLKSDSTYLWQSYVSGSSTNKATSRYYGSTDLIFFALTWDATADEVKFYMNGEQFGSTLTSLGAITGDLLTTYAAIGARTSGGLTPFEGWVGQVALFGSALSASVIRGLHFEEFPNAAGLLCIGDSKTYNDPWPQLLADALTAQLSTKYVAREDIAVGGDDVGELKLHIDADLAARSDSVSFICINIGANDIPEPTPQASFESDLTYVIDALLAKYPSANIYVAKVWRRSYAANVITINGYIDTVVASYSGVSVHAGHNEAVWLENGDDGATYTSDGVHPKVDGTVQPLIVTQWMTAFGY